MTPKDVVNKLYECYSAGDLSGVHGGDRSSFGPVVGTEECAVEVGGDHSDLHGASLAVNVR